MKTILINKANGYKSLKNAFSWKQFAVLFAVILCAGFQVRAQELPDDVWVRFNNPQYDCYGNTYCLDVEFKSETTLDTLFAVNLRFYYDDNVLEYAGAGEFATGYALDGAPDVITGSGSELFGFSGPVEFVNGKLQLMGAPSIELPVDGWLKYCKICFHVDAEVTMEQPFCPSIVWDLKENPTEEGGGFQVGDDGVVITLTDPTGIQESSASTEHVVQFNWQYGGNPSGYGLPVALVCIYLGCPIPLSNWSLILAIGLMIITTLFIFKKRMSN